jgi:hypothetical protein
VLIDVEQRSYMVPSMRLNFRYEVARRYVFRFDVWQYLEVWVWRWRYILRQSPFPRGDGDFRFEICCYFSLGCGQAFDMLKPSKAVTLIQAGGDNKVAVRK